MKTSFLSLAGLLAALPLAAHAQLTVTGSTLTVSPATTLSVVGSVGVGSGATLDNQGTLTFTGNLTNTGTIGSGAGTWQATGSTLQTLTAAGATLAALSVANAAGATLGQPLTVGALQFSAGPLRLAGANLTVTGAVTGLTGTSFVETNGAGLLQLPVSTSAVTFPLGPADGSYRPLILVRSAGTGTYAARVAPQALTAGPSGAPYASHAVALHWDVTPPDATAYTLTAQWAGTDELPGFNRALSTLARWNGSAYAPTTYGPATGSDPYQRSSSGLTAGGTFAVLDQVAPLPVELTAFTATAQGEDALLRWATASEHDNDHFDVEASADGQAFSRIGVLAGHGTTLLPQQYQLLDKTIARYGADPVYYRLRQVDYDGTATYSPVRTVRVSKAAGFAVQLYPNPLRPGDTPTLLVRTAEAGLLSWELTDALGRTIRRSAGRVAVGTNTLLLADEVALATGVYLVRVQQGSHHQVLKLVCE